MSAVSNIVLNDLKATPVAHTFVPVGQDKNGVWWFEDKSQASAIGFWRISLDTRRPAAAKPGDSSKNRVHRVIVGLHEPVLENVSNSTVSGIIPAPTLAYVMRSVVELILPERSTIQDRKDLRGMMSTLLVHAQVIDVIDNLNTPY